MFYQDCETYLNEDYRKPIKYLLRNVDKKTLNKVMELVDGLCDKYRLANGMASFYERKVDVNACYKEWLQYIDDHGLMNGEDYEAIESPFTPEEEQARYEYLEESLQMEVDDSEMS